MRKLLSSIYLLSLISTALVSCRDEAKNPLPEIKYGAHFIALPDPLPSTVTAANVNTITVSLTSVATASAAFTTQSLSANEIERVDAYISHVRGTTVTPAATTAAPNGVLLRALTNLNGKETISVSDMIQKAGVTAANLRANDRVRIRFVAVMKDGRTFSAQNSGPGITVNPIGTTFTPLMDILLQ